MVFCDFFWISNNFTNLKVSIDDLQIRVTEEIVTLSGKPIPVRPQLCLPEPAKEQEQVADLNAGILVHAPRRVGLAKCRLPPINRRITQARPQIRIHVTTGVFLLWPELPQQVCIVYTMAA